MQQIKVTLNDEDMDTFVFAVGTKKAMARLQKEMQDLVNVIRNFLNLMCSCELLLVTKSLTTSFFLSVSSAVTSQSPGPSSGSQTL